MTGYSWMWSWVYLVVNSFKWTLFKSHLTCTYKRGHYLYLACSENGFVPLFNFECGYEYEVIFTQRILVAFSNGSKTSWIQSSSYLILMWSHNMNLALFIRGRGDKIVFLHQISCGCWRWLKKYIYQHECARTCLLDLEFIGSGYGFILLRQRFLDMIVDVDLYFFTIHFMDVDLLLHCEFGGPGFEFILLPL